MNKPPQMAALSKVNDNCEPKARCRLMARLRHADCIAQCPSSGRRHAKSSGAGWRVGTPAGQEGPVGVRLLMDPGADVCLWALFGQADCVAPCPLSVEKRKTYTRRCSLARKALPRGRRHRFSGSEHGHLLKRDLGEAPQLARMQPFSFLGLELFQRSKTDLKMLADALAVEIVGHAGQFDLAMQRRPDRLGKVPVKTSVRLQWIVGTSFFCSMISSPTLRPSWGIRSMLR